MKSMKLSIKYGLIGSSIGLALLILSIGFIFLILIPAVVPNFSYSKYPIEFGFGSNLFEGILAVVFFVGILLILPAIGFGIGYEIGNYKNKNQ